MSLYNIIKIRLRTYISAGTTSTHSNTCSKYVCLCTGQMCTTLYSAYLLYLCTYVCVPSMGYSLHHTHAHTYVPTPSMGYSLHHTHAHTYVPTPSMGYSLHHTHAHTYIPTPSMGYSLHHTHAHTYLHHTYFHIKLRPGLHQNVFARKRSNSSG